ncbi:receptor-type tyrosine-protein phosphatase U-like [Mizuhopecten yessoensis]|uniref:receptor-type tyrosine-protein phosphatase U-like n=1 Tax=Mizuhopecten yessoensis TaxID=6573 RepID=UPI000B4582BF|nr:receptor-type tyrosine-protein phosphatase U-like [Mizuhopecten yessoensis]
MTYAFYVIRDISITHKKTKEERQVHQFHFTKWPDHGTPDTLELVLFGRRVTSYKTQLTGQMIVHCSAGIGRTGTFIGLNALLTHGKNTGKVDIPRYVGTMRNGRMNMIQTYEQYIGLHELLVEGFNLQKSLIFRVNFPAVLSTMCPTNTPANRTKIHQEFKVLKSLTPNYSPSCFKAALLEENLEKNRNKDILAGISLP